jgi:hypothetical protein
MLRVVILGLLFLFMTGCGSAVSSRVGSSCYPCDDTHCDCTGDGYGGPYNPTALNLFRPGRFEDLDSPGF